MNNLVIFPIIFFFLHTSPKLQVEGSSNSSDSLHTIYLIKQYWHTAVVFHKEEIDSLLFPEVKHFKNAKLIDIGWGDEAFYQHPEFDWGLAFEALFHSTPSTLRIEGINISKEAYFNISEIVVEFLVSDEQLNTIFKFLNETIWRDENGNPEIFSTQGLGRILFLRARGNYHLFNTCNTWLAGGLKQAGIDIDDDVVLTEQLFNEAAKVGEVIKAE